MRLTDKAGAATGGILRPHLSSKKWGRFVLCMLLLVLQWAALGQTGVVRSGGQPIPGATVTAVQGQTKLTTVTDDKGRYTFDGMTPGAWKIQVDMFGFTTAGREVQIGAAPVDLEWNLALKPMESPATPVRSTTRGPAGNNRGRGPGGGNPAGGASAAARGNGSSGAGASRVGPGRGGPNQNGPGGGRGGFQNLANQTDAQIDAAMAANGEVPAGASQDSANEAFLVNGSLTQGLQSTGAPQFGDGRFGPGGPGGFGGPGGDGAAPPGMAAGGQGGFGGGPGGGPGGFGGAGGGRGGFGGGGFGRGGGFRGRGDRGGRPGRPGAGEAFGNRSRGPAQIRGMASFSLSNSEFNGRPFSLTGQDVPEPSYAQSRTSVVVGGPLVIPKLIKSPNTFFFLSYFATRSRSPYKGVATEPGAGERAGDFSGLGTTLYDLNGVPFAGNRIPMSRIDPVAQGILNLNLLPLPNQPGSVQNYQILASVPRNTDNFGIRLNQNITRRDRLGLNLQLQRRDNQNSQLFGYRDELSGFGANVSLNYTRNFGARGVNSASIAFNRNRSTTTPFFAGKANIANQLGIQGTSQNPIDWGPPNLSFTNFGTLTDASYNLSRIQSIGANESFAIPAGKHNLSFGGNFSRNQTNILTDQNGRGSFTFTGISTSAFDSNGRPLTGTGYDFADFLLGLPQTASIRYGSTSNYFRGSVMGVFGQDDWRIRSNLSITAGLRWEYFQPLTEKYGRIANLEVPPDFLGSVQVVVPESSVFSGCNCTNLGFPASLMNPDRHDFAPRIGVAWKPWPKKSFQVRAGYGIYYVANAYNQFANLLEGQFPFAVSSSVVTGAPGQLTLGTGLNQVTTTSGSSSGRFIAPNTNVIDRYYRIPYAHTWSFSIQENLPASLVLELGYRGTKGTRLNIQRSPNTASPGSPLTAEERRQIADATGFIYYTSDGNSIYNALQVRLTRRFRRGISFNSLYTLSKSIDDSSTFGGAGNTVAQNPLDLAAERGLSSFDQRHRWTTNFNWTSPVGGANGMLAAKPILARLLKDWSLSGGLTLVSGTPLTARVLGNLADSTGTGTVGAGRAEATGLPVDAAGGFFNLLAFTLPVPGTFGNAGRNTIPGPGTFSLNATFSRSFTLGERRRLEFRVESNNVLNHVNYSNVETVVNAVDYGLPLSAGQMRTMQAIVRFRF